MFEQSRKGIVKYFKDNLGILIALFGMISFHLADNSCNIPDAHQHFQCSASERIQSDAGLRYDHGHHPWRNRSVGGIHHRHVRLLRGRSRRMARHAGNCRPPDRHSLRPPVRIVQRLYDRQDENSSVHRYSCFHEYRKGYCAGLFRRKADPLHDGRMEIPWSRLHRPVPHTGCHHVHRIYRFRTVPQSDQDRTPCLRCGRQ